MKNMVLSNSRITEMSMTSLEIANETGKQHKNVLADIRKMLTDLAINPDTMLELDEGGGRHKARYFYRLDEHLTWVLITKYSTLLRSAVIRRWKDLEQIRNRELQIAREISPSDNYNLACDILEKEGSMADEWFEAKLETYLKNRGLSISIQPPCREKSKAIPARRKK